MKKFQYSLSIEADAWHARWYRYWLSLSGKQPKYKENLCHYVRVLLIWAPLRWFFRGSLGKVKVVPWAATLIMALFAGVAASFFIWGETAIDIYLMVAGGAVVLVVLIAILAFAAELLEEVAQDRDWERRFHKSCRNFEARFKRPFKWLWNKAGNLVMTVVRWFFTRSYFVRGLAPVTVCIIAGFAVFGILATPVFLESLLITGAVVGVIAALFGVLFGAMVLDDAGKLDKLKSNGPKWFKKTVNGITDTVKLGVTYMATRKQGSRICPFIDLKEPETEPAPNT